MNTVKWIWLNELPGTNKYKKHLIEQFGDIETLFDANAKELNSIGCNEKQIMAFIESKRNIEALEKHYFEMIEDGIQVINIEDKDYPDRLKQIFDPPYTLFVKGRKELLSGPSIAMVGARKCSEYGFDVAKKLGYELARHRITVVSGLARGIDEASHKGALASGDTTAVLGTGIHICYPKENQRLYEEILEKGCMVSEYLPYTKPMKHQFPQRNRIISGLTLGTLIVEAEERSGSLITAQLALEQGREVFSVPGNIHSMFSKGTNKLIQEGAKLVTKVEDLLEEISPYIPSVNSEKNENNATSTVLGLDNLQIMVYDCLSWQPIQIETIAFTIDVKIEVIEMILLQLEIKGLVQRLPGRRYSLMK